MRAVADTVKEGYDFLVYECTWFLPDREYFDVYWWSDIETGTKKVSSEGNLIGSV
jgi:hypothetical protein